MLFNFLLCIFLGFELQKLLQFNFFFKLQSLMIDHTEKLKQKPKLSIQRVIFKVAMMDFAYLITVFVGFFSINNYFFYALIILTGIYSFLFKKIKNKTFRKIIFFINIVISILLLLAVLINLYFYHLDSISFIHKIFN